MMNLTRFIVPYYLSETHNKFNSLRYLYRRNYSAAIHRGTAYPYSAIHCKFVASSPTGGLYLRISHRLTIARHNSTQFFRLVRTVRTIRPTTFAPHVLQIYSIRLNSHSYTPFPAMCCQFIHCEHVAHNSLTISINSLLIIRTGTEVCSLQGIEPLPQGLSYLT